MLQLFEGGLRFEICDPDYLATFGMPLARVFRGLKSFWTWNSRYSYSGIPRGVYGRVESKAYSTTMPPVYYTGVPDESKRRSLQSIRQRKWKGMIKDSVSPTQVATPMSRVSYLFMQVSEQ
jgi:hypothetical protein